MTEIIVHLNVLSSLRILIAPCCRCNASFEVGKRNVSIPYVWLFVFARGLQYSERRLRALLNVKTTHHLALLISARFGQSPTGALYRMIRFAPSLPSLFFTWL